MQIPDSENLLLVGGHLEAKVLSLCSSAVLSPPVLVLPTARRSLYGLLCLYLKDGEDRAGSGLNERTHSRVKSKSYK
jgi:hypothetical protein